MELNYLDLFFRLPMFCYGEWFMFSEFPFNISFRFKSRQYIRIQYLDKSGDKLCVCDMNHIYHIINPNRIEKVIFFDIQNQKKFKGEDVISLISDVNKKMKSNISYNVPNESLNSRYIEVSIDNIFNRTFQRTSIGKCYFSDLLSYLKDFST